MRIVTAIFSTFIVFASATPSMAECDREEYEAMKKSGFSRVEIESICQQKVAEILAGNTSIESGSYTGDIRTGHYTNSKNDSGYFESLGGGKYKIRLWRGKAKAPSKDDWYNSGEGKKLESGQIHSTQPAETGHPHHEYEFEGYWKILGPGKIRLEKHRNYLKGSKPGGDVGWEITETIYTIVD